MTKCRLGTMWLRSLAPAPQAPHILTDSGVVRGKRIRCAGEMKKWRGGGSDQQEEAKNQHFIQGGRSINVSGRICRAYWITHRPKASTWHVLWGGLNVNTSALSVLCSNPQQLDTSHRTRRRENSRSGIKWKSADLRRTRAIGENSPNLGNERSGIPEL
jgi:hypothetical protein